MLYIHMSFAENCGRIPSATFFKVLELLSDDKSVEIIPGTYFFHCSLYTCICASKHVSHQIFPVVFLQSLAVVVEHIGKYIHTILPDIKCAFLGE